jgi:hemerythrin-like metal-binding protein
MLNNEKEVLTKILFYHEDYAKVHFDEEEGILAKFAGLPSKEHLNAHEQFQQYLYDLKFQYVSDDIAITEELLDYLVKWLKNHILVMDKKELEQLNRAEA